MTTLRGQTINEDSTPAAGSITAVAASDGMAHYTLPHSGGGGGGFPLAANDRLCDAPAAVSSGPLGDSRPGHYTAVL